MSGNSPIPEHYNAGELDKGCSTSYAPHEYTVHVKDQAGTNQIDLTGCDGSVAPALTT